MRQPPVSIETLQALLRLDPETGRLYWRERPFSFCKSEAEARRWNRRHAGKEALTASSKKGHRHGYVLGVQVKAHLVVFALAQGRWPVGIVDHRDTDPGNNRPGNLREATDQQNAANRKSHRGSASDFKGVTPHGRKWRAQIMVCGVHNYLGLHASEEAAARAYDAAALIAFGEFARLNFPHQEIAA